jgi:tRNA 2-selenouridine synthase
VIQTLTEAKPAALARFETIIDVRSPAEFALDHLPGAINLPVLDNDERARVGTIYVQESRFLARRVGAALVARNIARHLEGPLSAAPASFAPLVYCWRGGQRSGSMATVLEQVGWRPTLLSGGYKTWRRWVNDRLYGEGAPLNLIILDGDTGSAKTDILKRVREAGGQTIDLEGLAAHRGSLFGGLPDEPQPSQKLFESRLALALEDLDPARPTLVEAESSKVGEIILPPAIWSAMAAAPRIRLVAEAGSRARYLLGAYADIAADHDRLIDLINQMPPRLGRERLAAWRTLAEAGQLPELVAELLEHHYDPAYRRSNRADTRPLLTEINLDAAAETDRTAAADQILTRLAGA